VAPSKVSIFGEMRVGGMLGLPASSPSVLWIFLIFSVSFSHHCATTPPDVVTESTAAVLGSVEQTDIPSLVFDHAKDSRSSVHTGAAGSHGLYGRWKPTSGDIRRRRAFARADVPGNAESRS